MNRFKLLYFVIFIINLHKINAQISDKRLCVDEECKVPISLAKTLLRYSSPDSRILSFAPNADITIYSKSAGSREDLWGGEINGKRGYVPKHMVRETKVLQKPTLLVDTEFSNDTETKQVPSQVEPDKVQEPYEVVDGTTIYLSPQDDINPTSTDSPVQSTALPAETAKINEPESVSETPSKDEVVANVINQSQETSSPQIEEDKSDQNHDENQQAKTDLNNDGDENDPEDEDIEVDDDDDDNDEHLEDDEGDDESEVSEENVEGKVDDQVDTQSVSKEAAQSEAGPSDAIEPSVETPTSSDDVLATPQNVMKSENLETVKSEEPILPILPARQEIKETDSPTIADVEETNNLKEEPEPVDNVETIQTKEDVVTVSYSNEATVPPILEVTTLSPEFELPEPLDNDLLDVTPNPLETVTEEVEKAHEKVPTVPPLGLFTGFNTNSNVETDVPTESAQNKESEEENQTATLVKSEEIHVDDATKSAEDQSSVTEDTTEAQSDVSEESVEKDQTAEITEPDLSQETTDPYLSEETTEGSFEETSSSEDVGQNSAEEHLHNKEEVDEGASTGFFAKIMSFFASGSEEDVKAERESTQNEDPTSDSIHGIEGQHVVGDDLLSTNSKEPFCDATSCPTSEGSNFYGMDLLNFNSDVFLYLVITAISVIIFLFGHIAFDKNKRVGPLVAKINNLEKELLILVKENQILQDKVATDSGYENNGVSNEVVENLKQDLLEMSTVKSALEEQVQSLEKELENSTEVGMELNRMLSEILSSESGSDVLKANVEHLQRQLVEQQSTINSVNETLAITNTENHELRLEFELSNKKVFDLQAELDKLLLNILKIEEEKDTQQSMLETDVANFRQKYEEVNKELKSQEEKYVTELKKLKTRLDETERALQLKTNEHDILRDNLKQLKSVKNNPETIQNIIEAGDMKAELRLLKSEKQKLTEKIQQEQDFKISVEKRAKVALDENRILKEKYDEADKSRVEAQTKLEVLSNYFKDREAQYQKEISKHEALWAEKEGEATSTTERIKFMQEQLQNYKIQTDSLKQEIMSQEIELKSQISVLEKKAHENWVSARQAERKLEESKQEAAQLRHRLTLRERSFIEDKNQQRLQSPIEQNGDMPISPLESPASPLLYGTRDHITKSPPLPGLPPFLPPPPGVPFMPPPLHGVHPFIPLPPPNLFPGDHRPPPLGRMSSPPLNSRYSPSSRGYSPYDRNSSSPSDSEYGTSPPQRRGYSPFNNRMEDRRDYKRPPPGRSNGRHLVKGGASSGSGHSNESLEKISRQQSKV